MKKGWEAKKLGDITTKIGSGATPKGGQSSYKESGISLIRSMNVYDNGFVEEKLAFIDEEQATKLNNVTVEEGDVLLNITGASVARCCKVPKEYLPARVNQHVSIIRLRENVVYEDFLHYSLISKDNKDRLLGIGEQGSTRQAITKSQIEDFVVYFPSSFEEQKRIVKTLDKAVAAIDKAKANAEKNLQNSRELFDSYLNRVFAKPGEDWEEKKLGKVCDIIGGGTPAKSTREYYTGNIPWATVRDMKFNVLATTEFCITEKAIKESASNLIPRNNVVIATRVGLGKVCILSKDTAINQDLKGILPKKNGLDTKYLFYWFKSISKTIEENGVGATVKGVKIPFIENLKFPFPNLLVQKQIVNKLDEILSESKKLEVNYQQKQNDLEELKKTILQKAFDGQL